MILGFIILGAVTSLWGQAALAQVGPPTPLFPNGGDQNAGQTSEPAVGPTLGPPPNQNAGQNANPPPASSDAAPIGPASSGASQAPPPGSDNAEAHASIDTAPLAPVNPLSVAGGAALPTNLWQGTSLATLGAILPLVQPTTSPGLQSLALRMLASDAAPDDAGDPAQHAVWLALRAEKLEAMGHPDLALALLRTTPADQMNADMAQVIVDLAFMDGETKTACGMVTRRQPGWTNKFWDEAQITCQALNGEAAPAQIGLDALREENVKDDAFVALVQKVLGTPSKVPDSWTASPALALPLYAKAGVPLPRKGLEQAPPAMLRAIALNSGLSIDLRLGAAEKAAAYGAIAPEKLAEIYLGLPMDQAGDIAKDRAEGGAKARAILFSGAHDTRDPTIRVNLLVEYLGKAAKAGLYGVAARAAAPMIAELQPGPALQGAAADLTRALYTAGQPAKARDWAALLSPAEQSKLIFIAHLAGNGGADWGKISLADALGSESRQSSAAVRASTALRLLAAAGVAIPDALVLPLYSEVKGGAWSLPLAGPGLLLANAAGAKRLGASMLGALALLGSDGAAASPALVERAIIGLREAGLNEDARRLALDAAIAQGF